MALAAAQGNKKSADPALLTISNTGSVLHTPSLTAIFWGAEWTDASFAGDIISGFDSLLSGYSNSDYAHTPIEYSDRSGRITPFASYWGHTIDTSAAPVAGGLTSSVAVAEACRITNNQPDPGGIYVVVTSTGSGPNGCAFHTWGTCGTGRKALPIQVAAVPYASGAIGTGCEGVQDFETGHSLALAQMANLTMHEVVETITDPRGSGWRDAFGDEIADKCIKIFPPSVGLYSLFSNGSIWKLQAEWSNAAYLAGTGAPNATGQRACIW